MSTLRTHADLTTTSNVGSPASHWCIAGVIIIISWIAVLMLFWETTASMVTVWHQSRTFAHGFLILPATMYLIWSYRKRVAHLLPLSNPWGILWLGVLGVGWLFGYLINLAVIQQLALVAMLFGLTITVMGTRITRALLMPLGFLFFAVPIGDSLVPPFQDLTATMSVMGLNISGIPVLVEGRILSISTGTWEIAQTCSGVRYLIPAVALAYLYASVVYISWTRRIMLIVASVFFMIIANGLRAYGTIILAHNDISIGVSHTRFGQLIFLGTIFLVFWLGLRWREYSGDQRTSLPSEHQSAPMPTSMNFLSYDLRRMVFTAAGGILLLAMLTIGGQRIIGPHVPTSGDHPITLAINPPWEHSVDFSDTWSPHAPTADVEVRRRYTSGKHHVDLYLAIYNNQNVGSALFNRENDFVGGKPGVQLSNSNRDLLDAGISKKVNESIIRLPDGDRLIWNWYWSGNQMTPNPFYAKFLETKAMVFGGQSATVVIALETPTGVEHGEAVALLTEFLRHTTLSKNPPL